MLFKKGENEMIKCDVCGETVNVALCADEIYRCADCLYEWESYDEYDPREEAYTIQERNPGWRSW